MKFCCDYDIAVWAGHGSDSLLALTTSMRARVRRRNPGIRRRFGKLEIVDPSSKRGIYVLKIGEIVGRRRRSGQVVQQHQQWSISSATKLRESVYELISDEKVSKRLVVTDVVAGLVRLVVCLWIDWWGKVGLVVRLCSGSEPVLVVVMRNSEKWSKREIQFGRAAVESVYQIK